MNLYVSRSGQTFGPYTIEQAKSFLDSNQLLPSDYALIEGTTEWKLLPDILSGVSRTESTSVADEKNDLTPSGNKSSNSQTEHNQKIDSKLEIKKPDKKTKKSEAKVQKISKAKGDRLIVVAQEKSFISKLFSTIFVFVFLFLIAVGTIVGAYFAMPSKMGPILNRFGINVEEMGGSPSTQEATSDSKSPDEIMLSEDAWNTLRSSGIRILPMVGAKGLQVISSVDPELAMKDEDLEKLMIIAPHIISLDLTDSKVTNSGFNFIAKMPNLKKLFLEGVEAIDSTGITQLKESKNLEYLNLIRVNLEPSVIDIIISLEALREVYLFDTGLDESAIGKLKTARPQVFVNAG